MIAGALSSLVALGASGIRRVEKDQRIADEVFERDFDDIPRAREPGMRAPDGAFGLKSGGAQPTIGQSEAGAAVIVFPVMNPDRASILKNGAIFGQAVGNAGEDFGQVEGRIRIMADAEKENLPIQFVDAAHGTFGDVRGKRQRAGDNPGGVRSGGREGVEVIATQDARLPPEEVGDDSEVG